MHICTLYVVLGACYTVHILRKAWTQTMTGTVLLLEDDPMIRDLLDAILTDEGHDVRPCGSHDQLLAAARDIPASLALVDFWGNSHQELTAEERQEVVDLARTVPTILVSGRSWMRAVCPDELGLLAFVPKPFDVDALTSLVAECSERLGHGNVPATVA